MPCTFFGRFLLAGSFLLVLLSAFVVAEYEYVAIFDAGSSHTTLYVYEWPKKKPSGSGLVEQKSTIRCTMNGDQKVVLSSFQGNPAAAGASLKACLDFAKQEIPEAKWPSTKVFLGATAGMRLVALDDEPASKAIVQSVQDYIKTNYAFVMDPNEIGLLSPAKEAAYAWVSINFVQDILQTNALLSSTARKSTWGSLDVGGASAQFAMEVPSADVPSKFPLKTFNQNYDLLTWSFLCYGHDEAHQRHYGLLISKQGFQATTLDPCLPVLAEPIVVRHADIFDKPCSRRIVPDDNKKETYLINGSGKEAECWEVTKNLFKMYPNETATECPFQDAECSFKATKMRLLAQVPKGNFLAKGGLFYVTSDLRAVSGNSFDIKPFSATGYEAARKAQCVRTEAEIKELLKVHTKMELKFLLRMCFAATYNELLLEEIYGFSEDLLKNMLFANTVKDKDVGWSLGWAVVAATDPEPSQSTSPTSTPPATTPKSSGSRVLSSFLFATFFAIMRL